MQFSMKRMMRRMNAVLAAAVLWGLMPGVAGAAVFEDQHLIASDGSAYDWYGNSVAMSGEVAIVGAYGDDTAGGVNAGSAYVYRFNLATSTWDEEARLFASDGAGEDWFGDSVAISGEVAIVGAYRDDTAGGSDAGSAYVYRYNGATWIEEGHLFASDGAADDYFGISVALSGEVAIVAANNDDTAGGINTGSVYVYRYNGATWIEEGRLFASDGAAEDYFGTSVALSGEVVIVGANNDETAAGINAGSAYVYRFNPTTSTWDEEAKLIASDGAGGDQFGISAALSGEVAIVAAYIHDTAGGTFAGSAYVYRFNPTTSTWNEEAQLIASDGAAADWFGSSVALSGEVAIVGAFGDDTAGGFNVGSAYVYRFNGTTWNEEAKLFASDGAQYDYLGRSVALSGEVAIVGAYKDDTAGGSETGSGYVFDLAPPGPTIINVPGDFATIQAAINAAAVSGDEIIVAPGTYPEVINFNGKAINLHSASGNPADTIIDGTGLLESVVLCISGEGAGTILEGFTITGGNAFTGGGMRNSSSSPTVTNCIFSGNSSGMHGGGMYNSFSSPAITNCTFSGNSANSGGSTGGGGIHNTNSSNPAITNCTFSGNTATNGGGGGGMHNSNSSSPTIANCTFSGNTASFLGGGMINFFNSSPTITNCTFRGNTVLINGGGMWNSADCNPIVTNCTFSGNTAANGGGMYNINTSNPTVTNCTFNGNTATSDGGGMYNRAGSSPTVTNCILWGDSPDEVFNVDTSAPAINFSNVQGGLGAGSIDGGGNIDVDPLFVDPLGLDGIPGTPDDDFRLAAGSPSTDAGDNTAPGLSGITIDLDGLPRFYDDLGVADTGLGTPPIVDMGAYERQTNSPPPPAFIHVPADFATIQAAIDAAAVSGDEIIVAPGTYPEVINFLGKAINLHSLSGNPVDTIIDGTGLGDSVVRCVSGEGPGTILEGFTITGGDAVNGGGMSNVGSSPTVTNCSFNGNSASSGGGGMFNNTNSNPKVTNCTFSDNSALGGGGGMGNQIGSNPIVINCTFSGNSSTNGGGMGNAANSDPFIINCTFSENSGFQGGGMFNNQSSSPTVINCILRGGSPDEIKNLNSSTPTISFSNIQGGLGAGSIDGGGNIFTDPLFTNPLGPDGIPGTADDDLSLQPGSPCIDAGDNAGVPADALDLDNDGDVLEPTPLDLASNPRFRDDPGTLDTGAGTAPIVDMGALEFSGVSGGIGFDPPNETPAAGAPNIVAVGNLDTSGSAPLFGTGVITRDVAAVIPDADPANNGRVQVFLNQGTDGGGNWLGLDPQTPVDTGRDPTGIAIGQLDSGLFNDLAITNAGDGTVMLFMNDGSGLATFQPPITIDLAAGEIPLAVAMGDFNGDTLIDIVVANGGADNVVILENQLAAPGSFTRVATIPVGSQPVRVNPEDVDGDKDLDLVVVNSQGNTITILLNQSTALKGPGFVLLATLPVGPGPVDLAVGDLDSNGFPDFITANSDGTLSVIINQGLGVFDAAFAIPVGQNPRAVDLGDFDADSDLDLVVAADDPVIGPAVQVLENLFTPGGGLGFSAPIAFSVGADPNFVVTADLDDDGTSDVITVNNDEGATGGSVTALLNSPPCTGDITPPGGNGAVNIDDLVAVLNAFGACPPPCPEDITPPGGNGVVNIDDLVAVLNAFGLCP